MSVLKPNILEKAAKVGVLDPQVVIEYNLKFPSTAQYEVKLPRLKDPIIVKSDSGKNIVGVDIKYNGEILKIYEDETLPKEKEIELFCDEVIDWKPNQYGSLKLILYKDFTFDYEFSNSGNPIENSGNWEHSPSSKLIYDVTFTPNPELIPNSMSLTPIRIDGVLHYRSTPNSIFNVVKSKKTRKKIQ